MHASCESPWYLSAKHHVLEACFLLMVPFRTRFSPCEMVRTANVQRLRGCLYTLRYCYILTCRLVTAQLPVPMAACRSDARSRCPSSDGDRPTPSVRYINTGPGPASPSMGVRPTLRPRRWRCILRRGVRWVGAWRPPWASATAGRRRRCGSSRSVPRRLPT
jgi:hypothetical protein